MTQTFRRLGTVTALAALALTAGIAADAQAVKPLVTGTKTPGFFFHDGDRPIVFLGDSITEQRMYTTYIEAYTLSRFPKWNVTFRNVGWSGDGAPLWTRGGLDNGMKRDILPLRPASITIDYGMNDARRGDDNIPTYADAETKLTEGLKAVGSRVALVTSSPEEKYDAGQPGGSAYNLELAKYAAALKAVAAKENVPFIDQGTPFIKVIEAGRTAGVLGASGDPRLIPDSVHPNWGGHLVMATAILKGLNAPALVSEVDIDGQTRRILAHPNCTAAMTVATPGSLASPDLTFTRTDNALPWYAPPDAAFALKIPGFTPFDDLSRYMLRVTRLSQPSYLLKIDGVQAGTFTNVQLTQGVNLTGLPGPITDQTAKIFQAVQDKNNLYIGRWRNVQLFDVPGWLASPATETARATELARIDKQITDAETGINALRLPVPHTFTLTPAPSAAPATPAVPHT